MQLTKINKRNIELIFAFLAVCFFILFRLLQSSDDMWDGVMLSYASRINDFEGIKTHFFEASWFLQYYISLIIEFLSEIFRISFYKLSLLLCALFIFLLILEIVYFAKIIFDFNFFERLFLIFSISTFSIWHIFLSSIHVAHIFYFFISLLSIRLIHYKNFILNIIGFLILFISFELNSLISFAILLSYFYDLRKNNFKHIFKISFKTFVVFALSFSFFLIRKTINEPHGLFEGYNSIIMPYNFEILNQYLVNLLFYIIFLTPLIISLIIFLFFNYFTNKNFNFVFFKFNKKFLLISILFIGSFFPYLVAGKNPLLLGIFDWYGRQALLLSMTIPLISVFTFRSIYKSLNENYLDKIHMIGLSLFCFIFFSINIVILNLGFNLKFKRQIFEDKFINYFVENQINLNPGINDIIFKNEIPTSHFRNYEMNYLFFRIYSSADWWTNIHFQSIKNVTNIPNYVKEDKYAKWHVYDNKNVIECRNEIEVITYNSFGFQNAIKVRNFLKKPLDFELNFKINTEC